MRLTLFRLRKPWLIVAVAVVLCLSGYAYLQARPAGNSTKPDASTTVDDSEATGISPDGSDTTATKKTSAKKPVNKGSTSSTGSDSSPTSAGGGSSGGSGGGAGSGSGSGSGCTPLSTIKSGYTNNCTAGYKAAPDYPGSLKTCSGPIQSNTTYKFCNFPSGIYVGSSSNHPVNVTFYGCRFASNAVADANMAVYGDNITFKYSTFEPSADPDGKPPTTYNQGYQYGIDQRYNGKLTVDHSEFWGFGNGIQISYSSQTKPLTVKNSWFHDARDDGGGIDHTDAILENYGGSGFRYMTFHNNTIVSRGNTNGLALQNGDDGGYDHLTVTHNFFSGFGYTVNIGGSGDLTNLIFTDNVYSTQLQPVYGPLYSTGWLGKPANNNLWRNNKWYVPAGAEWGYASHNGWYWIPDASDAHGMQDDSYFVSSTDYSGY